MGVQAKKRGRPPKAKADTSPLQVSTAATRGEGKPVTYLPVQYETQPKAAIAQDPSNSQWYVVVVHCVGNDFKLELRKCRVRSKTVSGKKQQYIYIHPTYLDSSRDWFQSPIWIPINEKTATFLKGRFSTSDGLKHWTDQNAQDRVQKCVDYIVER